MRSPGPPMNHGSACKTERRHSVQMQSSETRHDSQILYYSLYSSAPNQIPARLARLTVAVVGVGGIGSELIRHLAVAGVGTLICVDGDLVNTNNLNRQLWFGPADVGISKSVCIAARVGYFVPEITVHPVIDYIRSPDDLRNALYRAEIETCDLIACCADEPIGTIESICLQVGAERDLPVAMAGMHLRRGYWGVFSGRPVLERAKALFDEAAAIAKAERKQVVRGSASWTNAIISAFLSEAVIALLGGLPCKSRNMLTAYDFEEMRAEVTADFGR
jgi:ThiF family protein